MVQSSTQFDFLSIFYRLNYGKERPESAAGCKEQFNKEYLKLIKYIWNFEKEYRSIITETLTKYAREKPIYILKSHKEIDAFINQIPSD